MTRVFQDRQIRQYLLGELPAQDETELETAYFGDPDLLARVEVARADLADDYAAARLSAHDRDKFERRLLATDDAREELAISKALRHVAAAGPGVSPRPVWRMDHRWLSLAAAAVLALGLFVAWRVVSGPDRSGDGREASVRPPQSDPQAPAAPSNARGGDPKAPAGDRSGALPSTTPPITLATLILTADLERSKGLPPTLMTSTGATHVDLVPPWNRLAAGMARARIESVEGASIWSGPLTVPEANASDPRPRARVPLSVLPPGDYFFSIESTRPDAPRYYFRVRAR